MLPFEKLIEPKALLRAWSNEMFRALLLRSSVVVFEARPSNEVAVIDEVSGIVMGSAVWVAVANVLPRAAAVTLETSPPELSVTLIARALGAHAIRRINETKTGTKIELHRQLELEIERTSPPS